jgi:two-component system LytT family response regulator
MGNSAIDKPINAVIIDDERLAIEGIKILLKDYPNINVVGSAGSIDEAVTILKKRTPDIIFLDIQLQGETGFELFEKTRINSKVIFVTAYDDYAINAFEINALDYLLKPVSKKRFKVTMDRVVEDTHILHLKSQSPKYDNVVILNTDNAVRFVKLNKIISINAEGDYSRMRILGEKDELLLRTLKAWEKMLPQKHFVRIHRSSIININQIERVEKTTSNRLLVHLVGMDTPAIISQRYSAQLRKKVSLD